MQSHPLKPNRARTSSRAPLVSTLKALRAPRCRCACRPSGSGGENGGAARPGTSTKPVQIRANTASDGTVRIWRSLLDSDIAGAPDAPSRSQGNPSTSGRTEPSEVGPSVAATVWKVQLQYKPPGPYIKNAPSLAVGRPPKRLHRGVDRPPATGVEVEDHREAMMLSKQGRTEEALRQLVHGHKRYPHNVYFPHSAAMLCAKLGMHQRATNYFRQALAICPDSGTSLQAWAVMEAKLKHVDQARELFARAGQVEPGNTATWCAWALFELEQGHSRKARQLFETALQLNPHHEPSLNAFARLEMELNNWDHAKALLQRVLTLNPRHAHSWTVFGRLCFQQGDIEQGRQMFQCVSRYCGEDSVFLAAWAGMELRVGQTVEAKALLERAVRLDRRNMPAWLKLAVLYARSANYERALWTYRTAIKMNPENKYLRLSYGQFLMSVGNGEGARRVLTELAAEHPNNGRLWNAIGLLDLQNGEFMAAAQSFKKGLRDPDGAAALLNFEELALLASQEGRTDVAREIFARGAKRHAPNSRYLRMWALLEKRLGDTDRSRELFRSSLDCDVTDVRTWVHYGLLERRLGNLDEALHIFREALKVTQENHHLWYLYCETATVCTPLEECRACFRRADAAGVVSPQLRMLEAMLEWKSGDPARAREKFTAGASLARGSPQFYSPIFEAWSRFEESQAQPQAAADILQEFNTVFTAEQELQRKKRDAQPFELLDQKVFQHVDTAIARSRNRPPADKQKNPALLRTRAEQSSKRKLRNKSNARGTRAV